MSEVIAINGSPRKEGNTATLLKKALEGAESVGAKTELFHLGELKYQGCISCFACKRKGTRFVGSCALKDDLTPVLEKAMQSKAIILGSPIYIGDVTALMRAFIERFLFMNTSYSDPSFSNFTGNISNAFFYTLNLSDPEVYSYVYKAHSNFLQRFGESVQIVSADTYQFDDYSKYDADNFNAESKKKQKETKFLEDCSEAYEIGKRFA